MTYLRTPQRRVSLRRLVELLGYIPAPGIAGSVTLAALAEGRKTVQLPAGTAFRSDAFENEPPQVFEVGGATPIHPFKNEWTIGPLQDGQLPQPTPTEIEQAQTGGSSEPGRFLVFETLEFGLAVNRLVLVKFGDEAHATRVASVRSFAGRDGRTYAEVELDPPLDMPNQIDVSEVSVRVPTVSARVTLHTALTAAGNPAAEFDVKDSGSRIETYLNTSESQRDALSHIVVERGDGECASESGCSTSHSIRLTMVSESVVIPRDGSAEIAGVVVRNEFHVEHASRGGSCPSGLEVDLSWQIVGYAAR